MEKGWTDMSKIEWCDITWNPVWGCLTGCKYCYARGIARRFAEKVAYKAWLSQKEYLVDNWRDIESDLKNFKPTFLESNFNKKFPKKPSRIFVNSMSDIVYWKTEWMRRVLERIKEYPQHTFIFLTKNLNHYNYYNFPENCWLGLTVNKNVDLMKIQERPLQLNKYFISLEPIQEFILYKSLKNIDWLIIGAETGNRKNKILPEKSWIEEFRNIDIPLFMKDNLKDIIDGELRQEFPK